MRPLPHEGWHAQRYGPADQAWVDRREQALVRELLAPYRGALGPVLDAPAGYGRLTRLLLELGARPLLSLDHHPQRLACVPTLPGALALRGSLPPLPLRDGACELAVCLRFLQHLLTPAARAACLLELSRCARRLILVSYYERASLHRLQRGALHWVGKRSSPLGFCSRAEVVDGLARGGFAPLEERALLPGLHAQRLLLAARVSEG